MDASVQEGEILLSSEHLPPFFIVGHPRSGTTLLRYLLSSHPRIHIPEETGFIPFLLEPTKIDDDLSFDQVQRLLQRIGRLNTLWHGLVDDLPVFLEELPEPRLRAILDALYRRQITPFGASRWGDKTPLYVRYVPVLERIFPAALFIHMIRDGRDATLSALRKWPERRAYMDAYYVLENWHRNITAGQSAGQRLGRDRYLEVRYEELATAPEKTMREVCAFLHESFDAAMTDHTGLARRTGPGPHGNTEVQQPISTASVMRWKTEMAPFEQKIANRLAGSTLSALGYQLSTPGPFTLWERLRYLLLACKFSMTDSVRTLLYSTGVFTLNRDLRRR